MNANKTMRPDNELDDALTFHRNHYGAVYLPTVCLCAWCGGVTEIGNPDPDKRDWITDKDKAYNLYLLQAGYYLGTISPNVVDPAINRVPECNVAGALRVRGKCDCTCEHEWDHTRKIVEGVVRCKKCPAEFVPPSST